MAQRSNDATPIPEARTPGAPDEPASRRRGGARLNHRRATYWSQAAAPDALAGTIVGVMLVPQAMAYAMLAGLPPEVGLYASTLPLLIYAVLGTSRELAVGPVAVVSLLVAHGIAKLGAPDPATVLAASAWMALSVGALQLVLGMLRAGVLANRLSHGVISGFTGAAAIVIAASQAKHLIGIELPRSDAPWRTLLALFGGILDLHPTTAAVGIGTVLTLVLFPPSLRALLRSRGTEGRWVETLPRVGPLVVVVTGILLTRFLNLAESGLSIVGEIPPGIPEFQSPTLDSSWVPRLGPTVLAIAWIGFLESFAVAQGLAQERGEPIDGSREMIALGAANLGSSVVGGLPIAGGFSRTMVNAKAGARSRFAAVPTAALVMLTLAGSTDLLHDLPHAVLAGIIVVAVLPLVDPPGWKEDWRRSPADAAVRLTTFVAVLGLGIERGILVGIAASILARRIRGGDPRPTVPPG